MYLYRYSMLACTHSIFAFSLVPQNVTFVRHCYVYVSREHLAEGQITGAWKRRRVYVTYIGHVYIVGCAWRRAAYKPGNNLGNDSGAFSFKLSSARSY